MHATVDIHPIGVNERDAAVGALADLTRTGAAKLNRLKASCPPAATWHGIVSGSPGLIRELLPASELTSLLATCLKLIRIIALPTLDSGLKLLTPAGLILNSELAIVLNAALIESLLSTLHILLHRAPIQLVLRPLHGLLDRTDVRSWRRRVANSGLLLSRRSAPIGNLIRGFLLAGSRAGEKGQREEECERRTIETSAGHDGHPPHPPTFIQRSGTRIPQRFGA
jgi:hypothetical protein